MSDNTLFVEDFEGYTTPYQQPERWYARPLSSGQAIPSFTNQGPERQASLGLRAPTPTFAGYANSIMSTVYAARASVCVSFFARCDNFYSMGGAGIRLAALLFKGQAEAIATRSAVAAAAAAIAVGINGAGRVVVCTYQSTSSSAGPRHVSVSSSGTTILSTSAHEITTSVLHHFELSASIEDGILSFEVMVDGIASGSGSYSIAPDDGQGIDVTLFGGVSIGAISQSDTHFSNLIVYDQTDADGVYRFPMGPMRFRHVASTKADLQEGGAGEELTELGVLSGFDDVPAGTPVLSAYLSGAIDAGDEAGFVPVTTTINDAITSPFPIRIPVSGLPSRFLLKAHGVDSAETLNNLIAVIRKVPPT